MSKLFLRIKGVGACVSQVDLSQIISLNVTEAEDDEFGGYLLSCMTEKAIHVIKEGTFDTCHMLLNQINDLLDIDIVDL